MASLMRAIVEGLCRSVNRTGEGRYLGRCPKATWSVRQAETGLHQWLLDLETLTHAWHCSAVPVRQLVHVRQLVRPGEKLYPPEADEGRYAALSTAWSIRMLVRSSLILSCVAGQRSDL